jgi:Short C-terminal domain
LALILIALMALGVEALRRHTAREFPNASREEAMRSLRRRWAAMRSHGDRPTTATGNERLSELERLGALHKSGVLDDAEFKAQKAQFLL